VFACSLTSGALSTNCRQLRVFSGDNGQATQARLYKPQGVAVDANNNILIADTGFARVRRISAADGTITTIAGNGNPIITSNSGTATTTAIGNPFGVAVGPDGSVYIAAEDVDLGGTDSRIWKVAPDQTISTIAGGSLSGYSGDNGPATAAQLNGPSALAVDGSGNVYIADSYNYRVRRINASDGKIVTFAGTGVFGLNGDNGPATAAQLSEPKSLALDPNGNLYIGDLENGRVRMVASNGTITTFSTAGGSAVAAGTAGIFVANRQRIFQYFPDSVFAPISGLSGTISGISGDNNGAITALITVTDMAVTSTGAVIFVDSDDNVIRKLTPVPQGSAVIAPLALGLFSRGGGLMSTSQTLSFAVDPNSGTSAPAWTAAASVTTPNGGTWLSVSPPSGNGTSNVSVTVENTGLAAGSYQGAITITCGTCVIVPS
jgi:sugar lactone lactonase YvrE